MRDTHPLPQLPDPAPGFAALVGIHLRLTVREARLGTLLLGAFAVGLPLAALRIVTRPEAASDFDAFFMLSLGTVTLSGLAVLVALLWPDTVWRQLQPGRRWILDALPVSRRAHRMARVAAGSLVPLVLMGSVALTIAIAPFEDTPGPLQGPGLAGIAAIGIGLLAGYAFSSALALLVGQVLRPLFYGTVALAILPLPLELLGFSEGAEWLWTMLLAHAYSPIRVVWLGMGFDATAADLVPAMLWLAVFGGLVVHLAGRHDRV